jgi:hypothetical protein
MVASGAAPLAFVRVGADNMNMRFGGLWGWLLVAAVAVGAVAALLTGGNGGGLWFLLVLACPLMMLLMMGSMQRQPAGDSDQRHRALDDASDLNGLTEDERVRLLRTEMTRMNWRQESLRQELERLERECAVDESPASAPH